MFIVHDSTFRVHVEVLKLEKCRPNVKREHSSRLSILWAVRDLANFFLDLSKGFFINRIFFLFLFNCSSQHLSQDYHILIFVNSLLFYRSGQVINRKLIIRDIDGIVNLSFLQYLKLRTLLLLCISFTFQKLHVDSFNRITVHVKLFWVNPRSHRHITLFTFLSETRVLRKLLHRSDV